MDSNAVESLIRPLTLQRKSGLFAGHDEGAANWACIASLIETCMTNGAGPFAHIVATTETMRRAACRCTPEWGARRVRHG